MLRTLIEHKVNDLTWEPAFPLWYGEPSDPVFAFDVEANLARDLIDSGITVVTDRLPEYSVEELNIDGTADWYYADFQKLLDSPLVIEGRRVLEGTLKVVKLLVEQNGCPPDHMRVMFYKPLLLDIR